MEFRNELIASAAAQLARDYCCTPEDFLGNENKVTLARSADGQRRFKNEPDFFRAATMGFGTVISTSSEMLGFSREILEKTAGAEIFEQKNIWAINRVLAQYNKAVGTSSIYYMPSPQYRYVPQNTFRIKLYEEDEIISELYPIKGFANALLYNSENPRRDKLAVCALNGGRIVGMAGASSDSPIMWQIGIDVLPGYRGMGIGWELVAALTQAVFMHGAVPYYGTWNGNIASQNTARKAGYRPVWAEMFSFDVE